MFLGKIRAVPYKKGKFIMTTKLSIELYPNDGSGIVSQERLDAIIGGCIDTLRHLGGLAPMIEAIRVTWAVYELSGRGTCVGPNIKFHFTQVAGLDCGHSSDFRFMGNGSPTPSSRDIAECFCRDMSLPRCISEHIRRCSARLNADLQKLPRPVQFVAGS